MNDPPVGATMAQKSKGPGIQSAAGLIRYFDAEEDTNLKVPPVFVLVFGILSGLAVIFARIFWEF